MVGHHQIPDIWIRCYEQDRQICADSLPVFQFSPDDQHHRHNQNQQRDFTPGNLSSILYIQPCLQISLNRPDPIQRFFLASFQPVLHHAHGPPKIPDAQDRGRKQPLTDPGQRIPEEPGQRSFKHKPEITSEVRLFISHPEPQQQNQRNPQRKNRVGQKIKEVFHHTYNKEI